MILLSVTEAGFSYENCFRFKTVVSQIKHMFDDSNRMAVLERIFLNPGKEYHLRGLAKEVGLAPSTVSRIVDELEEEELVEVERDLKMSITGSRTERFLDLKRSFNLARLAESGLIDRIEDRSVPEAVVVFGSYAKGEDTNESDIDLAFINGREKMIDLEGFERELERQINIQYVEKDKISENFLESLANGITLRGYLEV